MGRVGGCNIIRFVVSKILEQDSTVLLVATIALQIKFLCCNIAFKINGPTSRNHNGSCDSHYNCETPPKLFWILLQYVLSFKGLAYAWALFFPKQNSFITFLHLLRYDLINCDIDDNK